jgi:NADH:ubiquinone oxidoreductase subunit 6 (subunit J)
MEYFLSFISAFLFGGCTLVIGVQNPIHSILILILVFLLGSILLFVLQVEYFALLFMIVYVGAIVVLFLFIVMMLEIKMVNVSERFRDLFSFRNLILAFLVIEVLLLSSSDVLDIAPFLNLQGDDILYFKEANLYTDYSKILQRTDHLRGIGGVLYTEYKLSVFLAAVLLFLSMVGSIVMTLDSDAIKTIKMQDANHQALRHPTLISNSFRGL